MYDQFGREMTQRELWRQLNHQFHGIKPSAKRSERELESYKRELSAKKKANADTPLGSMQMLKAATKVTWLARYVNGIGSLAIVKHAVDWSLICLSFICSGIP
jgi:U4/U6.U5 tri-snRNP-associated protein 1